MLQSPEKIRKRLDRLSWQRDDLTEKAKRVAARLKVLDGHLEIAAEVTDALEHLGQELFEEVLGLMEEKLSRAIEEVLDQPIQFKSEAAGFQRRHRSCELLGTARRQQRRCATRPGRIGSEHTQRRIANVCISQPRPKRTSQNSGARRAGLLAAPGARSAVSEHCAPCLLYTSPSPRDRQKSRMPSSA